MHQLPADMQPYEKCRQYGPDGLSDAELLAVILRTGSTGKNVLSLSGEVLCALPDRSLRGLCHISQEELLEIPGIGAVKSVQLQCIGELGKRISGIHMEQPLVCDQPEAVAGYFMPEMRFLETEQVRLLVLDAKNRLIRSVIVSHGSFNAAMAGPREVFYLALKHRGVAVILMHNHPSGDPAPSREDLSITRRLSDAGRLMGIELLDHIIIGDDTYVSLKEQGYMCLY